MAPAAARSNGFALLCAIAVAAGCASEPDSHVVSAPPPPPPNTAGTTVTSTTTTTPVTTTQPANTVIVQQAPPPAQAEVVLAQPSPDYSWVPGHWTWRDNQYEWLAGHWEMPAACQCGLGPAPHGPRKWRLSAYYEGYWN